LLSFCEWHNYICFAPHTSHLIPQNVCSWNAIDCPYIDLDIFVQIRSKSVHKRTPPLVNVEFNLYLGANSKSMVNLRRPNRYDRNSGFNTKYISLILAATMSLVLWGYQKIYSENPTQWFLYIAIGLGVLAFALAVFHIFRIWANHRKGLKKFNNEQSPKS
jgi:hypothetical protein